MTNKILVKFTHDHIVHILDADKIVAMSFWVDEIRRELNLDFEFIGCDQSYNFVVEIDEPQFDKPSKWIGKACNILFPLLDNEAEYCKQIDVYEVLNDIEDLIVEKLGEQYSH